MPQATLILGEAGSRLLEREEELKRLTEALSSAAGEADGTTILVEGPPGVGKSALLRAAGEIAAARDMQVLRATGRQIEGRFAFGIATQLLVPVIEPLAGGEREELLSGAAGLALAVLRPGPSGASLDGYAALHGLHWLCANLAARQPVAILIDDAHWADQPSLDFIPYLASRIGELPICLIVAVRSAGSQASDRLALDLAAEGASVLRPAPLSLPGVGRLAASRLRRAASPSLVSQCAEATGGNPLFVRELLRHLVEHDDALKRPISEAAPRSVGLIVLERIQRMSEDAGSVIRTLAILGDGAEPELMARLAELDAERVESAIDDLIAAGLLEARLPPRFEHPIVRQAVYEAIAPGARARAHLLAARDLAGRPGNEELAAVHLLEAGGAAEPAGAEAIEALRAAARIAKERGASEQGVRFLARALDERLERDVQRELLLELGTEELRLGDESSLAHLQQAEHLSGDPVERAQAALALSVAQSQSGLLDDAVATCERALESIAEDDRELWLALVSQHAAASWLAGTTDDQDHPRLGVVEREAAAGETPAERLVLTVLAAQAAQSGSRTASEVAHFTASALHGGDLLDDLGAEHLSYTMAVAARTMSGEFGAAIEDWSRGVEHSRRRGSLYGYANALLSRGYARYLAGDLTGAEDDAIEATDLLPESDLISAPFRLATAASVAVERGEPAPEIEQALEQGIAGGDLPPVGTANYALLAGGWLALSRGEAEWALERFELVGRRAEMIGWTGTSALPWRSGAAQALNALGRTEEATPLVEEELRRGRVFEAPAPIGIALRTKSMIAPREERVELAREAAAVLAGSEAKLEQAKALVGVGMALRRAGAPRDARPPLREGMDLANRCGSDTLVERALQELRAAGMRPRRPAVRGAQSLSPQQRQTARLAAGGMSNREIAEAMFLTRRTVEMHLTGTYRKLGIDSRTELAEALEGEAPPR